MTRFFALFTAGLIASSPLKAAEPIDWGINLQDAASPVKVEMVEFHNLLLVILSGICLIVLGLLIFVMLRFNKRTNPVPSKTTHNVSLEIIWTIVPVIILVVIAIPSFKLLYYTDKVADPDMTLKVTGYQWFWGYEYPDYEITEFQSYMIADEDVDPEKNQKRLLSTDYPVVLPINTDIQILVTAGDVLHSFAIPSFGIKKDAIPGRLNETWVNIMERGTYYGQCSELCGAGHAYMPIEIRAVSKDKFEQWVRLAKDDLEASYEMLNETRPPEAIFEISQETDEDDQNS